MAIILAEVFILPLKLGFELRFSNIVHYYAYHFIPGIILALDILVKLNTGIYEEGEIVLERKFIVKRYLRYGIWVDAVTTICLFFSVEII